MKAFVSVIPDELVVEADFDRAFARCLQEYFWLLVNYWLMGQSVISPPTIFFFLYECV